MRFTPSHKFSVLGSSMGRNFKCSTDETFLSALRQSDKKYTSSNNIRQVALVRQQSLLIKSHVTPLEYKLSKLAANEVSASNDGLIFNR